MKTRSIWATVVFAVGVVVVLQSACSTSECATDADCEATLGAEYECRVAASTCVKRSDENAAVKADSGSRSDGGADSGILADGGSDAGADETCIPGCNLGQSCVNGSCVCDGVSCPNGCCTGNACTPKSDCGTCSDTCQWNQTGQLASARRGHTATLLPNGKVFVTGGYIPGDFFDTVHATCELYDPTTNSWSAAASMKAGLSGHRAVLLSSGKVLVCGGSTSWTIGPDAGCAIYDPASDSWTAAAAMTTPRSNFALARLSNGKVIAAGGFTDKISPSDTASTELYDPEKNEWTATSPLSTPRRSVDSAVLSNGGVLVTSGFRDLGDGGVADARAEVFDSAKGTWTAFGMPRNLASSAAVSLGDGRVLIAGGATPGQFGGVAYKTAFTLNPVTGDEIDIPMAVPRTTPDVVLLSSGRVLVVGGSTAEIFDPTTNAWSDGGTLSAPRLVPTATRLANGNVLVVGGDSTADIFR